jgi:hypothetical protein
MLPLQRGAGYMLVKARRVKPNGHGMRECQPVPVHASADLIRIHPLQHDRIAKRAGKPCEKCLLEQLEVTSNLNIVTRGARLYDAGSRVNLDNKVDLLSLDEGTDKRIGYCKSPNQETIYSPLIHTALAPVIQERKILPRNNGGRGHFV